MLLNGRSTYRAGQSEEVTNDIVIKPLDHQMYKETCLAPKKQFSVQFHSVDSCTEYRNLFLEEKDKILSVKAVYYCEVVCAIIAYIVVGIKPVVSPVPL